jgi:serine protease Do
MCLGRMPPVRPSVLHLGALLALAVAGCRARTEAVAAPARTEAVLEATAPAAPLALPGPPVPVEAPSLAPLVELVLPTVVAVEVDPNGAQADADEEEESAPTLPEGHPPVPGHSGSARERSGAGVLLGGRGLVLTSFHFVRDAGGLAVHLADGRSFEAELIGRDGPTDLALLRLRNAPRGLPAARLGDSRRLRPGDWVLAVGNPFGLSSSVSHGVVSAVSRQFGGPYDEFLQTDAALNPGSSGGPLFDMRGEVVGIAIAVPVAAGIGFAIPSSVVGELLPGLEKDGGVTRGALGTFLQDITPALGRALGVAGGEGALVSGFVPGSAAQRAGLERDDVVVALDGEPVASRNALIHAVGMRAPASTVWLTLVRGGQQQRLQVTLGTRTDLDATGPLLRPPPDARVGTLLSGLGLELTELTRELAVRLHVRGPGALVEHVTPGSAADVAGLLPGALITEFGGMPVRSVQDALGALRSARGRPPVLVRIQSPGGAPGLLALSVP